MTTSQKLPNQKNEENNETRTGHTRCQNIYITRDKSTGKRKKVLFREIMAKISSYMNRELSIQLEEGEWILNTLN